MIAAAAFLLQQTEILIEVDRALSCYVNYLVAYYIGEVETHSTL